MGKIFSMDFKAGHGSPHYGRGHLFYGHNVRFSANSENWFVHTILLMFWKRRQSSIFGRRCLFQIKLDVKLRRNCIWMIKKSKTVQRYCILSIHFQKHWRYSSDEARKSLKIALLYFIKTDLTELAQHDAFDDNFGQKFENLAKLPTLMNAFITRSLASSQFVLLVPKCIWAKLENKTH